MVNQSSIVQMVDCHRPFPLDLDHLKTHFPENLGEKPRQLPPELEVKVQAVWQAHVAQENTAGRLLFDHSIVYLLGYDRPPISDHADPSREPREVLLTVRIAPYSKSHFFNRADEKMEFTDAAEIHGYDCMAAFVMVVTNDRKAVFVSKPHHGSKKVSGFSGFNTSDEIKDHSGAPTWASLGAPNSINYTTWFDRLFNRYSSQVRDIPREQYVLGLNFLPEVGPRGYDLVCSMKLDITAAELERLFASDPTFAGQHKLFTVSATPRSLLRFLHQTGIEPTTSCVGGVMQYIGAVFPDALEKTVVGYHGPVRVWPVRLYDEVRFTSPVKYAARK